MDNVISGLLYDEIKSKINNKSLKLAGLPDIILKVNEVLADDRKSIQDITKVVQNEVALSMRIVQIANSPALRGQVEIKSIGDAISRLGISLVKNLAICVSLKDRFNTKNMIHKELMDREIHKSMQRSIYCFMVAKFMGAKVSADMSLISGLVSNIGHLVVLRFINDDAKYQKLPAEYAEDIILAIGDKVGDLILLEWDFPREVPDALFGNSTWNQTSIGSYSDVYALVNSYLEYKTGNANPLPIHVQVDEMIKSHHEEFMSLEIIFN
jgi:HD-like signal output (HDOD) protein